jgi:adenylate cyclase class IV
MPEQRTFRIRLYNGKEVAVTYRGRKMSIRL